MASVSTYINFLGNTEEAFAFYASAFGTEPISVMRFGDMPPEAGGPELPEADRNKLMHIALPILGGHVLMATDMLESLGHDLRAGNNFSINLQPDTRDDADRLHAALAAGAIDDTGLQDMPWGAYWASFLDKFGIRWMINVPDA
jgi:PhnB protein